MKFTVVTTYADRHWEVYGRRFVSSFTKFWSGVDLLILKDQDLENESAWFSGFKRRHASRSTENYRMDAVRFAHKVAAIELAYLKAETDALVWMDADCVTHAAVDENWLAELIGDAEFAYLKRKNKYPECGFMMFRVGSIRIHQLMERLCDLYRTDKLFELKEWHDSYAIDYCRAIVTGLRCKSLSGNAEETGHPLVNGPLGARLDHLKGKRKAEGRSRKSDLKVNRTEEYWK